MDKQKQILAAALRLFVEFGFHGTPTSKIAQEADVANGTLFHYYKTKDDLVVALYNSIKEELAAHLSSLIHESDFIVPKFRSTFINTLYWALQNPDKFKYIQQFESSPHMAKISAETIELQGAVHSRLLADGIQRKLIATKPLQLILSMFNSQIYVVYLYLIGARLEKEEQDKIIFEAYEMSWDLLKFK